MKRIADRASLAVIAGYIAIESTRRVIVSGRFDVVSLGDFMINLSRSQQILAAGAYGDHFYYPVPFLLIQQALAGLGLPAASVLFFALVTASGVAVAWLSLESLHLTAHRWRWSLALAAYVSVIYFVQWDLRAGNANLVVLALLLVSLRLGRRGRGAAAGALLSLAIALKLYGIVLLPYLAFRRRWSWLASAAIGIVALFVVLPCAVLGPAVALDFTLSWWAHFSAPGAPLSLPDYYKPLERSLLLCLTAAGGPERSLAAWPEPLVVGIARGFQVAWVAAVAAQLARARTWSDSRRRWFADVAVLLLLPLPFSPTFQAHHAVVLLLTAFWMVAVAADPGEERRRRLLAVSTLVLAALLVKAVPSWPARAVAIFGAMAIHLAGLLALPPRTLPRASVSTPSDAD